MRAITIVLVLASACGSSSDPALDPETVVVTGSCGGNGTPLTVDSVETAGDMLYVHWHAFGGCNEHAVYACWDGTFAPGYFPIATIMIGHDDFEDECDGIVDGTSEFSLHEVTAANHGLPVELDVEGHRAVWQP